MHNYTSSLFHYTGQRKNLISILKEGLLPNFCKEQFLVGENSEIIGIPMVSFCDIPIMRAQDFSLRYGKYAIALTKEWGLRNYINPIFYVNDKRISNAMAYFRSMENYFGQLVNDTKKLELVIDLAKSQKLDKLANFIRFFQTKNANNALLGFTKSYEMTKNGKSQVNYEENEWRYVVNEGDGVEWLKGTDAYQTWRGISKKKPKAPQKVLEKKLVFSVDDITYLITQNEVDTMALLRDIKDLKSFCGQEITEFGRYKLINKIISFEKIENDF